MLWSALVEDIYMTGFTGDEGLTTVIELDDMELISEDVHTVTVSVPVVVGLVTPDIASDMESPGSMVFATVITALGP